MNFWWRKKREVLFSSWLCSGKVSEMELGNSTRHILNPGNYARETNRMDFCDLHPNICGMEAGCHSPPGSDSYICLCNDLLPAEEDNNCDRKQKNAEAKSSTHLSATDTLLHVAPTEGSFSFKKLQNMLSKQAPSNTTDANNSSQLNATSKHMPPTITDIHGPSAVVIAFILTFIFLSLLSLLLLFVYRKHKGQLFWWTAAARRPPNSSAISLSAQQYITNPNYYSASPEAPLLSTLRNWQIPQESVTLMEEIGEGCFGKVHKGLYTDPSGVTVPVAVKTLKDNYNQDAQTDFEREVEIMSAFSHENILKLQGIVHTENQSTPWMVFEFMRYGDLAQLLRSNGGCPKTQNEETLYHLNQLDLLSIANQICQGMVYLSSQHFVHRDLATRNCLVGDNLSVKISDFGMSRDIYTSDYYKVGGSRMLPIRWMAPESITYGKFSLESDVWAYGVVLWEIYTLGKQPYYGHSNDEVVKLVLQGILLSPPENCPNFICNIMAGCWKTEPKDRLAFSEVHDFISPHTLERDASPSQQDTDIRMDSDDYLIPTSVTVSIV